jgi:divalent metal cation (Fe/Co/Zn/Cd) transporter
MSATGSSANGGVNPDRGERGSRAPQCFSVRDDPLVTPTATRPLDFNLMQIASQRVRAATLRRGLWLEYFTLTWNLVEAAVGMAAGIAADSVALVGFALDSLVESSSAGILIWRLRAEAHGGRTAEEVEGKAIRLVALAFFALAAYVAGRSAFDLLARSQPEESSVGIGLALVSLVVMPLLAWRKHREARELDSRALQADSTQTSICTYLSAFLLIGLVANASLGWWWADPLTGLVIALFAAREGRELWTAEDFCCR